MDDENKRVQNPFGTGSSGANAFRAAYDRLKAEADAARGNIAQDYAGAYQQVRQQTYGQGLGAAAQSGLSGGQAGMMRNRVSAGQMQALGGLMQGQESAMRQQRAMEGSMYSNALLEGQQAQQMENERLAAIAAIYGDKKYEDLTASQQAQLRALGDPNASRAGSYTPFTADYTDQSGGEYFKDERAASFNKPPELEGYELVLRKTNQGYTWYYQLPNGSLTRDPSVTRPGN